MNSPENFNPDIEDIFGTSLPDEEIGIYNSYDSTTGDLRPDSNLD